MLGHTAGELIPALTHRSEVLKMRSDLAWTRFLVAELRAYLTLKAGFDPNQPRDDDGRWTDTGASGGRVMVAQAETPDRYKVNLAEEEARGGHAIRRHVGRSDIDLIVSLKAKDFDTWTHSYRAIAEGTFLSIESANDLVNRTLELNASQVDLVANGALDDAVSNNDSASPRVRKHIETALTPNHTFGAHMLFESASTMTPAPNEVIL